MTSTQASIQAQFMLAAEAGDCNRLEPLFRASAEQLDSVTIDAALLLSSKHGHLAVVEFLMDTAGASAEVTDADGVTPLLWAQRRNHQHVVHYLKSALIAEFKRNGRRVLSSDIKNQFLQAARHGALDSIQLLIQQHGYSILQPVDIWNDRGHNALHLAASNDQLETVRFLLTMAGANVEATENNGYTPLHCACMNGNLETVNYLVGVAGANVEATGEEGRNALHVASLNGHADVVHYLVQTARANIEATDAQGCTCLHTACDYGWLSIVQYLVGTAKANVAATDEDGWTPLAMASSNGHLNVVQYLLSTDAASTHNRNGMTPLHAASGKGRLGTVQYLLSTAKYDVDARDINDETALHYACIHGHIQVVQCLIEAGANVEAMNELGSTALHMASDFGHAALVVHLHAEANCNVRAANKHGLTSLHFASDNGYLEIVQYLVEVAGVSIHTKDEDGNTPEAKVTNRILESGSTEPLESVVKYLKSKRLSQIFALAREYPTLFLGVGASVVYYLYG
jgi:ankyrin repeat protein